MSKKFFLRIKIFISPKTYELKDNEYKANFQELINIMLTSYSKNRPDIIDILNEKSIIYKKYIIIYF